MISSGKGSVGSPYTTNADSDMSEAESAVDAAIRGMLEGTKPNPYITIQEEIVGSVVDVPAADATTDAEAPATEAAAMSTLRTTLNPQPAASGSSIRTMLSSIPVQMDSQ